jgi:hypothetical protein
LLNCVALASLLIVFTTSDTSDWLTWDQYPNQLQEIQISRSIHSGCIVNFIAFEDGPHRKTIAMSSGALGSVDHPARWNLWRAVFRRCHQNGFTIAKPTIDV